MITDVSDDDTIHFFTTYEVQTFGPDDENNIFSQTRETNSCNIVLLKDWRSPKSISTGDNPD